MKAAAKAGRKASGHAAVAQYAMKTGDKAQVAASLKGVARQGKKLKAYERRAKQGVAVLGGTAVAVGLSRKKRKQQRYQEFEGGEKKRGMKKVTAMREVAFSLGTELQMSDLVKSSK